MSDSTSVVQISNKAQEQMASIITSENKSASNWGIRIGVNGGGCSGLSYFLEFNEQKDHDFIQAYSSFSVFIDPKSAIYLKDVQVDFEDGLQGKGFVFKNPNAKNTCGCGESFSV